MARHHTLHKPVIVTVLFILSITLTFGQESCTRVDNCETCPNPDPICEACEAGTLLNSDKSRCLDCPKHCTSCTQHSVTSAGCAECEVGWYVASGSGASDCEQCPSNCDGCKQSEHGGLCEECEPGYYLLETAKVCQTCSSNCGTCENFSKCITCHTGFYLQDGSCFECPSGISKCDSCTSASKCDNCKAGRYWDGSTCDSCMDNCAACSEEDACTTCSDGYFLGDEDKCYSAAHCSEWTHSGGCTACDPEFRLADDKTCAPCPGYDEQMCPKCMTATQGMWWAADEQECNYCPENCLTCSDQDTCTMCVDGMVWDTSSGTGACTACAAASLETDSNCMTCEGKYWQTSGADCEDCPTDNDLTELTDADMCLGCRTTSRANFWGDGTCEDVGCSGSLTEAQCPTCANKFWGDNGSGTDACNDIDCSSATLDTENKCTACATANNAYWVEGVCMEPTCSGLFDSEDKCNYCVARAWDDTGSNCNVVDCSGTTALTQEICTYCPGKYWDVAGGSCADATCSDPSSLATPDTCGACRHLGKYWDGSACQTITDCSTANNEDKCKACRDKTWDGSSCVDVTCSGALDTEAECLSCATTYWDSSASPAVCTALSCQSVSALTTQALCLNCAGHYWDGSACNAVDCDAVFDPSNTATTDAATTRYQCEACSSLKQVYWDQATTQCQPVTCESDTLDSEIKCDACANRWVDPYCKEVDCSVAASTLLQDDCAACPAYAWNTTPNPDICDDLECEDEDDIDTEEKCRKCAGKFWEDDTCKSMFDCATGIIHSAARCNLCSTTDAPKLWNNETGSCFNCPENCRDCSENACLGCVDGRFWNAATWSCDTCEGATLDTQEKCNACPGKVWEGNQCKACPENCVDCSHTTNCLKCSDGMIWDHTNLVCQDCLLDKEEECLSCRSSTKGKYFAEEDQCLYCSAGCGECDDSTTCTTCTANMFLTTNDDESVTCTTCSGATLDSEVACNACGGDSKWWDDDASSCEDCIDDCLSCTSGTNCAQCPVSMFFDPASTSCSDCPRDCEVCTSASACTTCEHGKFWDSANTECTSCPTQCLQCDTAGCKACNSGYYLSAGSCESCIAGCDVCTTATTCSVCSSGSCLNVADNTCVSNAGASCTLCELVDGGGDGNVDDVSCLTCPAATFLEVCKTCTLANCKDCSTDNTKCDECMGSYFYDETANTCTACPGAALCSECSSAEACDECMPRYYYAETANTCSPCPSRCSQCSESDGTALCDTCDGGYYKDADNNCQACVRDCAECYDGTSCRTCEAGTTFSSTDSRCNDCPSNCATCGYNDAAELACTECSEGYFLAADGTCTACSTTFTNCNSCKDGDGDDTITGAECASCRTGYVLLDDQSACSPCSINDCDACSDPVPYCSDCSDGYLATEDKEQCAYACYSCSGGSDGICYDEQTSNSSKVACPGLGSTASCIATVKVEGGAVVTHSRACQNTSCSADQTADSWSCQTAGGVKECVYCCNGDECNAEHGKKHSGAGVTSLSWTLITTVVVLVTAGTGYV